jgi:hypothetical protein
MFVLTVAHPDWYADGVEDGEQCWRLDPDNVIQVQVFATLVEPAPHGKWPEWENPRLFIERDRRDASGEKRIDYACDSWAIADGEAAALLTATQAVACAMLKDRIERVLWLPCDPTYIATVVEKTDDLPTATNATLESRYIAERLAARKQEEARKRDRENAERLKPQIATLTRAVSQSIRVTIARGEYRCWVYKPDGVNRSDFRAACAAVTERLSSLGYRCEFEPDDEGDCSLDKLIIRWGSTP